MEMFMLKVKFESLFYKFDPALFANWFLKFQYHSTRHLASNQMYCVEVELETYLQRFLNFFSAGCCEVQMCKDLFYVWQSFTPFYHVVVAGSYLLEVPPKANQKFSIGEYK